MAVKITGVVEHRTRMVCGVLDGYSHGRGGGRVASSAHSILLVLGIPDGAARSYYSPFDVEGSPRFEHNESRPQLFN